MRIGTHSSILRLIKLVLTCLILLIAFPSVATALPQDDVINPAQGNYDVIEPVRELPYSVLSNCYQYIVWRFGNVPPTAVIKSHLGDTGEIGFMRSNGYDHYVVIEEDRGDTLLISDTNFYGHTKSTRVIKRSALTGFYSL